MQNFIAICVLVTLIKLALMPFYHSTDFEVHRNWLAITHSLPPSEWYTESTSPWTLDYPPAFAYFEWALSQCARHFDPQMLRVQNLDYASPETVRFQRLSVILTDPLLMLGVLSVLRVWRQQRPRNRPTSTADDVLIAGAILANCGLLLVDHIHFQYNGVLYGLLLLSIAAVLQRRYIVAALLFAWLLCMKHIFLYVAPVFGVFLLRSYVLDGRICGRRSFGRFAALAAVVLAVFGAVFAPFVGQLPQLAARLFPFKRGLTHAYWAPNVWALYNAADKVLAIVLRRPAGAQNSGGLVSEFEHSVLPSISPAWTFALTAIAMVPVLWRLWTCRESLSDRAHRRFVQAIVICGGASFMFGWHVHEKAILMLVVPLAVLGACDLRQARHLQLLCRVAHFSLFPLLDVAGSEALLTPVKYALWLLFEQFLEVAVRRSYGRDVCDGAVGPWYERVYSVGFHAVFVYAQFGHDLVDVAGRWPFVPLMLYSVYCAVGVLYFWLTYYWQFMIDDEIAAKTPKTKRGKSKAA